MNTSNALVGRQTSGMTHGTGVVAEQFRSEQATSARHVPRRTSRVTQFKPHALAQDGSGRVTASAFTASTSVWMLGPLRCVGVGANPERTP